MFDNKKFNNLLEYVSKVAFLNEEDVKHFALSIGNLQLSTKEHFQAALDILRFLGSDWVFDNPADVMAELNQKFNKAMEG